MSGSAWDGSVDRSGVETEARDHALVGLDRMSMGEVFDAMNRADATVAEAVAAAKAEIVGFIDDALPRFARGGRLVYLGAGTSGRLGVLDASECPPTFCVEPGRVVGLIAGGDRALRVSSESKEDDPAGAAEELDGLGLTGDDSVLGIAAGGTTPWVRGGLTHAAQRAGCVGMLSCSPVEAPEGVGHLIVVRTGAEVLTGSTRMKAGTATKLVLNTISTAMMVGSGRVYENLMVDVRATNAKLRDRAARIVGEVTGLERGRAIELLERCGGEVKVALVVEIAGVEPDAARAMLSASGGRLRDALAKGTK
ncbi:MAG: N-acetylmuramic acid 6-phosphate etherase [Phycisphaerales bacterium]